MPNVLRWGWGCLLVAGTCTSAVAADVPGPEAHLGYRPGADFRLAAWSSVVDYFRKVDDASDRVVVRELGKTTEGRPYLVAIVSDPSTIKDLDRIQKLQRDVAQPVDPSADGSKLAAESKPVVLITCSIHSNEPASTFMAMELLHELASKEDAPTREILENAILVLVPSANPDGVDKVAAWYERTKGHPWEGEGMPELYHKYAGHDTNRDWFMLNLQETKLLTRFLYRELPPTLAYDVHQMGSKGARMFVPPFFDPMNPNLDPKLNQGIFLVGAHMAADLAAAGKSGVLTNAMYDNWWNGGMRTTPQRHNVVAVLTEASSVKLASPIFLDKSQLAGTTRGFANHEPAVNFVEPWTGGWWRLRDIVDYELLCARSILALASRYRVQFQSNYHRLGQEAIRKGRSEPPFGFVVPVDPRDPANASRMVRILHDSGLRVLRSKERFTADGATYPAGTWLLPADQPYRAHLKDMMERQQYPNRLGPGGAAEPPYDVAGWTLPLQMGAKAIPLGTPYRGEFEEVRQVDPPVGSIDVPPGEAPEFYALRDESLDAFRVTNDLFREGVEMVRLSKPAGGMPDPGKLRDLLDGRSKMDRELPADTILIKASPRAREVLDRVIPSTSIRLEGRSQLSTNPRASTNRIHSAGIESTPLIKPSIALYQPWIPNMDEGWTRFVFEQFDFEYSTIHDADLRSGNLIERFRTIVLPSILAKTIRDGYRPGETEPAYVGGLGAEGVTAIRKFVEGGGTLVCLENSCLFAIEALNLPVKEVLKELKSSDFYAPGSILRCEVAGGRLTVGMPYETSVYFDRSLAFDLLKPGDTKGGMVYLTYAKGNPLESGWLLGPEKIQGKAALVEVPHREGRVILFGFPPQHRGQTHATFRLLFNALK